MVGSKANTLGGISSKGRREEYCRIVEHPCDRINAVVITDISMINLDSHRPLSLLKKTKFHVKNIAKAALRVPQMRIMMLM